VKIRRATSASSAGSIAYVQFSIMAHEPLRFWLDNRHLVLVMLE
jgi:hypothetical protein